MKGLALDRMRKGHLFTVGERTEGAERCLVLPQLGNCSAGHCNLSPLCDPRMADHEDTGGIPFRVTNALYPLGKFANPDSRKEEDQL